MSLVPKHIELLKPYKAGKSIDELKREKGLDKVIKLASNENPLGPSPLAIKNSINCLSNTNRYPDPFGFLLREKLANKFKLSINNVVIGSGSEGIMSAIMRTFLSTNDEIIASKNSFIGFRVLANASGIKTNWVDMKDYHYDLNAMANVLNTRTKIIYLANPDNPTGTYFSKKEFDTFMDKVPSRVLVILDEAYFEYAQEIINYPNSMDYRHDNVITLRTFSKAYGLSGYRLGYGFGHKNLIENLMKVKLPFEPSMPAQYAGIAAMDDIGHIKETLANNKYGYKSLTNSFNQLGINYIKSVTNFITILLSCERESVDLTNYMLDRGIILRHLGSFGISHAIRVTIGTKPENKIFIRELRKKVK